MAVSGGAKHTLLLSQIRYKLTEADTHNFFYAINTEQLQSVVRWQQDRKEFSSTPLFSRTCVCYCEPFADKEEDG